MELEARVQVGEKGRIVIPAGIREAMGIRVGDSLELRFASGWVSTTTM